MKTTLLMLLCIVLLFCSSAYAGPKIRIEDKDEQQTQTIEEHKRIKGIILITWSIYASYLGYRMLFGKDARRYGDTKLVGGLLLSSSVPLFIWGIKLTF